MDSVQIERKSYEMPPRYGLSIAHFLTVKDIERSARFYEKVYVLAFSVWATETRVATFSSRIFG